MSDTAGVDATRRIRRWSPFLLVAVLIGAVGVWFLTGRRSDPPSAYTPTSPDCLHIQGETIAQNDRWRVIHTGDGGEFGTDYSATPVVACDARLPGQARVRLLGMAKYTGEGEDYNAEDGPYMPGGQIGGDIALIDTRFYDQLGNEGGFKETGYTTLFDLRRGTSTRLPGGWLQRLSYDGDTLVDHSLLAHVTSSGGVATVYATQDGRRAPTRFGPMSTWDASGRRTRPERIDRIADTRARSGDDGGFLIRRRDGTAGRVGLHGAASTADLQVDPKLAWRVLDLKSYVEPSEPEGEGEAGGSGFSTLPDVRGGRRGTFDDTLWLQYRPSDRARNRTVRITTYLSGGPTLARLAKGSDAELRTLGSDGDIAIIIGRFREQPDVRRVRMVGQHAPDAAQAFFDLPGTPSLRRRGTAVVGGGIYALTDGAQMWLWGPSGGHVLAARGLRDLTLASGGSGVFATDAQGRPVYFPA